MWPVNYFKLLLWMSKKGVSDYELLSMVEAVSHRIIEIRRNWRWKITEHNKLMVGWYKYKQSKQRR